MDENIEHLEVIETTNRMGRALIAHDRRSRSFPANALVPDGSKPRDRCWRRQPPAYDQGQLPHCVAYTGKGLLNTLPATHWASLSTRRAYSTQEFYDGAQARDEWEGSYDGTSALGLCRHLKEKGIISEYRWCFGLQDVLLALSHVGPVALGCWWWGGMMRTNSSGFIRPTGSRVGGHEVQLRGIDVDNRLVTGMNSWGTTWGWARGQFVLTWDDLGHLLADYGDAVVLTADGPAT